MKFRVARRGKKNDKGRTTKEGRLEEKEGQGVDLLNG